MTNRAVKKFISHFVFCQLTLLPPKSSLKWRVSVGMGASYKNPWTHQLKYE